MSSLLFFSLVTLRIWIWKIVAYPNQTRFRDTVKCITYRYEKLFVHLDIN